MCMPEPDEHNSVQVAYDDDYLKHSVYCLYTKNGQ